MLTHPTLNSDRAYGAYRTGAIRRRFLAASTALRRPKGGAVNYLMRTASSVAKKLGLGFRPDPFDMPTVWGGTVRLYPRDNTTDRWMLEGEWPVDEGELQAVRALYGHLARPLTFMDIGANCGLYTLQLLVEAGNGVVGPVLCVEPNPPMQKRLEENLVINGFDDVLIAATALSDVEGSLVLETDFDNLGQVRAPEPDAKLRRPVTVPVTTLKLLIHEWSQQAGIADLMPDVVKIDIEGHEITMLDAFWSDEAKQRPPLMIVEMWTDRQDMLVDCMERGGYRFISKPSENAIFLHKSVPDLPELKN